MRRIVSITLLMFAVCALTAKPRITVIATGGTIAGLSSSSTHDEYKPGVLTADQILATVPGIGDIADVSTIQLCNIASQNMTEHIWLELHRTIDSLFTNDLADGVVITHGTDTMEETAYFLHLTVKHKQPVVLVGAMRPATSLSADGPMNLYDAVCLASSSESYGKGVMITMNKMILSAEDATKGNTVMTDSFYASDFGPLGVMRGGEPDFYREPINPHTYASEFDVCGLKSLPKVEIVFVYAFASPVPIKALIHSKVDGIVIAGVGHGNYNDEIGKEMEDAVSKGISVVRSSRIISGGVDLSAEEYSEKFPVAFLSTPQKARILLMLTLLKTKDYVKIQKYFKKY